MKKYLFFIVFALCAALAACTGDDPVDNNSGNNGKDKDKEPEPFTVTANIQNPYNWDIDSVEVIMCYFTEDFYADDDTILFQVVPCVENRFTFTFPDKIDRKYLVSAKLLAEDINNISDKNALTGHCYFLFNARSDGKIISMEFSGFDYEFTNFIYADRTFSINESYVEEFPYDYIKYKSVFNCQFQKGWNILYRDEYWEDANNKVYEYILLDDLKKVKWYF